MAAWDARIDPNDPAIANGAVLLYSGGSDSSAAACRLAQRFPVIHLVTFTRFGFLETDNPGVHFQRMQARWPDVKFVLHKIPYGKFYEEVESFKRLRSLMRYGTMTSVPCGHCKVAMHWRAALFCKEHGIKYSADGAVLGNEQFAEQNPRILMPELATFYDELGMVLTHPVYEEGLDTEHELYRLGITDHERIKRTKNDKQVICSQHILFAMHMRKYLAKNTFEEYETMSREYLRMKLAHIRELTQSYLADPVHDKGIARLLG